PELLEDRNPGVASDLYAMGVIACELITGQLPFANSSVMQLVNSGINEPPKLNPLDGYPQVRSVIARLLKKAPAARYRRAIDAAQALAKAADIPFAEQASVRESFLKSARFIGREAEISAIMDAHDAMYETGQGGLWFIGGE